MLCQICPAFIVCTRRMAAQSVPTWCFLVSRNNASFFVTSLLPVIIITLAIIIQCAFAGQIPIAQGVQAHIKKAGTDVVDKAKPEPYVTS
jgi:hypothetical protein